MTLSVPRGASNVPETDWLSETRPLTLLEALPGERWERKLRLAACGLWWRYAHLLDDAEKATVRTAERYAEGLVAQEELAPHRARGLGVASGSGRTAFSEVYLSISNKARL